MAHPMGQQIGHAGIGHAELAEPYRTKAAGAQESHEEESLPYPGLFTLLLLLAIAVIFYAAGSFGYSLLWPTPPFTY